MFPMLFSPWMKVHGPIEARSSSVVVVRVRSCSPWMKVHGPIEAVQSNTHAAAVSALGFRRPDQKSSYRMTAIERIEEPAHLIATPDITALKLRQRHVAAVDVVEDGGDFHYVLIILLFVESKSTLRCSARRCPVLPACCVWWRTNVRSRRKHGHRLCHCDPAACCS